MIDAALFVPLFVSLLTDFNVTCALGQHRIKDARYFVRRGSDGLLATGTCFDPTVERANAVWLRYKLAAAMRNAWVARLGLRLVLLFNTFPPEILVPGHKPSQEAKCFSVFQGVRSKPTSLAKVSRVSAARPGMANRSTPLFLNSKSRTSTPSRMRWRARTCFSGVGGSSSEISGCFSTSLIMAWLQSAILA